MRILYVANHEGRDNDDEGAITFVLEQLGHEVLKVDERARYRTPGSLNVKADLCLFHKWPEVHELRNVADRMPTAFWFFDLVDSEDPTLVPRAQHRKAWLSAVMPFVSVGFCTDGDWVARDETGKLVWLMQGADERVVGPGTPLSPELQKALPDQVYEMDLTFFGMVHHGQKRAQHLNELKVWYGNRFHILGDRGPSHRVHGRALADVMSCAKIIIAPDGPNTDRYWSNRVYQALGFGAFLLHPFCLGLLEHYRPEELQTYASRAELIELIDYYLKRPDERLSMAMRGYARTLKDNLYRHRVERLLETVKERCHVG